MRSFPIKVILFIVIFFSWAWAKPTVRAAGLSVPAEFVRNLQVPGRANHLLRPSAIFIDHEFNEVFVADPGHNRIAIFDSNGVFRYEFAGGSYFSTPVDVAVDREGYIWVLGTSKDGRKLTVFDFDGLMPRQVPLPKAADSSTIPMASFDLGPDGEVYLLDEAELRVYVLDSRGSLIRRFDLLADLDAKVRREQVLGKLRVQNDRILVPSGSLGRVYVYDLDGRLLRTFGHKGTDQGELNFPVAAVLAPGGGIFVLDKHRFNVVCYGPDGKFLGEFGGRGSSPGWFYHPTLLDIDDHGLAYIGQIFQNKIQVCRVPDFIRQDLLQYEASPKERGQRGDLDNSQQLMSLTLNVEGGITKLATNQSTCFSPAASTPEVTEAAFVNAGIRQPFWR